MEFECVSYSEGLDEVEIPQLHPHIIGSQFSSSKLMIHKNNGSNILCDGNNGGIETHPTS